MSAHENSTWNKSDSGKQLVRKLVDGLDRGRGAIGNELLAQDCTFHGDSDIARGPDGFRRAVDVLATAFPNFQLTIDDLLAEGDRVVSRITLSGIHRGPYLGIAPTGKAVRLTAALSARVAEGKIAEVWIQLDRFALLEQLGAVNPPRQSTTVGNS